MRGRDNPGMPLRTTQTHRVRTYSSSPSSAFCGGATLPHFRPEIRGSSVRPPADYPRVSIRYCLLHLETTGVRGAEAILGAKPSETSGSETFGVGTQVAGTENGLK